MEILIYKDATEASQIAAEMVRDIINKNSDAVLGLATGSTPIEMYQNLIQMVQAGDLSFEDVRTVNLDEYIGLSAEHPQSYRYFMNEHLFNHIDIDINNTHVPDGLAEDLAQSSREYEALIDELGGQDCQILGLGQNGHVGFNEPNSELDIYTHVEELTESTIHANQRFFDSVDEVPRKAISMGMGSIFKAKKIILLAFGEAKADAIQSLEDSKISTQIPVTLLKLHPDVTVIIDEAAASKLHK